MTFAGQRIFDVVMLTSVAVFTVVSMGHNIKLLAMRHNFFIVLR